MRQTSVELYWFTVQTNSGCAVKSLSCHRTTLGRLSKTAGMVQVLRTRSENHLFARLCAHEIGGGFYFYE